MNLTMIQYKPPSHNYSHRLSAKLFVNIRTMVVDCQQMGYLEMASTWVDFYITATPKKFVNIRITISWLTYSLQIGFGQNQM